MWLSVIFLVSTLFLLPCNNAITIYATAERILLVTKCLFTNIRAHVQNLLSWLFSPLGTVLVFRASTQRSWMLISVRAVLHYWKDSSKSISIAFVSFVLSWKKKEKKLHLFFFSDLGHKTKINYGTIKNDFEFWQTITLINFFNVYESQDKNKGSYILKCTWRNSYNILTFF